MAAKKKKKKVAKKATKKKATKKKATKKKATKKVAKKPATKAAPAKPAGKLTAAKNARTKSDIMTNLADQAGITKKDVNAVFDALSQMIGLDLAKGSGQFTVPGLMKIMVKKKPATKARKGVNPFTGEEMMFKAKPARNIVKIRPLKGLKDKV